MDTFGDRLRRLRKKENKSQRELGQLFGLSESAIGMYERNARKPDFETLNKFSDYFGVSTDFLLNGKEVGQLTIPIDEPEISKESPTHVRFPLRLKKAMDEKGISSKEFSNFLGIDEKDFKNWLISPVMTLPDEETLRKISLFVGQSVSYLLGSSNNFISSKDEKDIAKRMDKIREDLTSEDGLMFNGEPMSKEAIESFLDAMEYAVRQTQRINKKYIPKKYRENEEN